MGIIQGDKLRLVQSFISPELLNKDFIIIEKDISTHAYSLRSVETYGDLFPTMVLAEKDKKNNFYLTLPFEIVEKNFKKIYVWTPWRKCIVYHVEDLLKYNEAWLYNEEKWKEENRPTFKTNRKTIFLKAYGIKVKVTCHKDDTFDLQTGIEIALERWKEKASKIKKGKEVAKVLEENVDFEERNCDLFSLPCYYHIAHCISSDFSLKGAISNEINKLYNMKEIWDSLSDLYCVGEVLYHGNIFNLVTNLPYEKVGRENLNSCIDRLACLCFENKVSYLGIPYLGTRNKGLSWEETKKVILKAFQKRYNSIDNVNNIRIKIMACKE